MREGAERPDGSRDEPALDKFEAEIARHKATQEEVQVCAAACLRHASCVPKLLQLAVAERPRLSRQSEACAPCWTCQEELMTLFGCLSSSCQAWNVQALPSNTTSGYIRVDGRPAKQALSTWVSKWVYLYTLHLQSKARSCLWMRRSESKHWLWALI